MARSKRAFEQVKVAPAKYVCDPVAFIDQLLPMNEKGEPWQLSDYQRQVMAHAFRFDVSGRLALRLLLWSEPKKSGKTFLAACLALWWAMTRTNTEVIVVANDLEQAAGRVFRTMVKLAQVHGLDRQGFVVIRATEMECVSGTLVTAIASDYRGAAGSRHSLVVFDELWGYQSEALARLYEELTPPPTEANAWLLVVTYAGFTGESALLERLYQQGLAGERIDADLEMFRAGELVMFWSHTARQPWQTPEYYAEQRRSLRATTFARIHENRWVSAESVFITGELWDACVVQGLTPRLADATLPVFVAVDAAQKHDTAAVVAVAWDDGKLRLVSHRIWTPTPSEPLDLEATIEAEIRSLCGRFVVQRILTDPWQMARSIATLKAEGLPIEELPQTLPNLTAMGSALWEALRGRNLRLYPDAELRQQALNTIAVDAVRGWKITKEKASKKIDAIVALAMACYAAIRDGQAGEGLGMLAFAAQQTAVWRGEPVQELVEAGEPMPPASDDGNPWLELLR